MLAHAVAPRLRPFRRNRPARRIRTPDVRHDGTGPARSDKGDEAAQAAVEMANLRRQCPPADAPVARRASSRCRCCSKRHRRNRAGRDVPPERGPAEVSAGIGSSRAVVAGTLANREALDGMITRPGRPLAARPDADRRPEHPPPGPLELLHEPATPRPVVIDGALERCQRFSTPRLAVP